MTKNTLLYDEDNDAGVCLYSDDKEHGLLFRVLLPAEDADCRYHRRAPIAATDTIIVHMPAISTSMPPKSGIIVAATGNHSQPAFESPSLETGCLVSRISYFVDRTFVANFPLT